MDYFVFVEWHLTLPFFGMILVIIWLMIKGTLVWFDSWK